MATINIALKDFKHPYLTDRQIAWDIQYFTKNEAYLAYIQDPKQRKIAHYFFLYFKTHIQPKLQKLRRSAIHGDANELNLLVNNGVVTGIIDFGDMSYSQTINDLAIALTYAIMEQEKPIEQAVKVIRTYHSLHPLEENELHLLYYLIAARLCTSVCQSAYNRSLQPDNAYVSISEEGAWALLTKWISINPLYAENAFRKACDYPSILLDERADMLAKRSQYISKSMSISYQEPIQMNNAVFQYMYSNDGAAYLDGVNNIMHLGHCHPKVVEAAQKQFIQLNTNTRYLYHQLNEYAEKLAAKFPPSLQKVFFVNSGSAASDLAIRLALTHTKRKHIMVLEHGYHGNTQIGIDISSYKFDGKGGQGAKNNIITAPIPDPFRGKYRGNTPETAQKYAQEVAHLLEQSSKQHQPIAAFIGESIIGCGGQVIPPPTYFQQVYQLIRAQGGVCIADEVQIGFGRVGTHFWGFEQHGVVPDIVVMGKPIGNGHPLAAVITTPEMAASFENGMEFFSSFGGNPISCAIGLAVLETIEDEGLQEHALEVGNYLLQEFRQLQSEFSEIGDVRGTGLFLGIELIKDAHTLEPDIQKAKYIVNALKQKGILLSTDGPYNNVLKFKPPLCFSWENASFLVRALQEVLRNMSI